MVKDERYPVRTGLPAAPAVDASPEQLRQDGNYDGEEDEAQDGDAPRVVVVQEQLDAARNVWKGIKTN